MASRFQLTCQLQSVVGIWSSTILRNILNLALEENSAVINWQCLTWTTVRSERSVCYRFADLEFWDNKVGAARMGMGWSKVRLPIVLSVLLPILVLYFYLSHCVFYFAWGWNVCESSLQIPHPT